MALAELKNRLSEVVDRLEREHGRVVITKHGISAGCFVRQWPRRWPDDLDEPT